MHKGLRRGPGNERVHCNVILILEYLIISPKTLQLRDRAFDDRRNKTEKLFLRINPTGVVRSNNGGISRLLHKHTIRKQPISKCQTSVQTITQAATKVFLISLGKKKLNPLNSRKKTFVNRLSKCLG